MKITLRLGWLIAAVLLCAGCRLSAAGGEPLAPAAETPPDIRGTITDVQPANVAGGAQGLVGSIRVEGPIEAGTKFDKASVRITNETHLVERQGEERRAVTMEALAVGQRVEAWFTGPVAESYPVQATALEVVILR